MLLEGFAVDIARAASFTQTTKWIVMVTQYVISAEWLSWYWLIIDGYYCLSFVIYYYPLRLVTYRLKFFLHYTPLILTSNAFYTPSASCLCTSCRWVNFQGLLPNLVPSRIENYETWLMMIILKPTNYNKTELSNLLHYKKDTIYYLPTFCTSKETNSTKTKIKLSCSWSHKHC